VHDLVTIAEAKLHSKFTHEHIAWLVRTNRVQGRKSGNIWLVSLSSLTEYEKRMDDLGSQKHNPNPD
jgi:hypothetical protein